MAANVTYIPFPIVIPQNPIVIYPTEAPVDDYSFDIYAYVIVVFVLITFLSITKAIITRRQREARRVARIQARTTQTRPGQVSSVSATVDANTTSTIISDPPSTSRVDAHAKVDLPPTYDEVMKHYLEAKEAAASSSSQTNINSPTNETRIEIDDSSPPGYSSV